MLPWAMVHLQIGDARMRVGGEQRDKKSKSGKEYEGVLFFLHLLKRVVGFEKLITVTLDTNAKTHECMI